MCDSIVACFCSAIAHPGVSDFSGHVRYDDLMDIVKGIVVVLHIISFGVVFGAALAQLPNLKHQTAQITKGVLHGALGLLVTGLVLVGLVYATGGEPNNAKIGAKTLVLLALIAVVIVNRKKTPVSGGVLGAVAGLAALNVTLAVIW